MDLFVFRFVHLASFINQIIQSFLLHIWCVYFAIYGLFDFSIFRYFHSSFFGLLICSFIGYWVVILIIYSFMYSFIMYSFMALLVLYLFIYSLHNQIIHYFYFYFFIHRFTDSLIFDLTPLYLRVVDSLGFFFFIG